MCPDRAGEDAEEAVGVARLIRARDPRLAGGEKINKEEHDTSDWILYTLLEFYPSFSVFSFCTALLHHGPTSDSLCNGTNTYNFVHFYPVVTATVTKRSDISGSFPTAPNAAEYVSPYNVGRLTRAREQSH